MPSDREIVVPLPSPLQPFRNARSTVILSSIDVFRHSPRWEDYVKALDPRHKETLLTAVAASWIPLPAASAHYAAGDALELSVDEQVANGRKTFDRAGSSIFGTVIKLAKNAGVTPWTLISHFQRFWTRTYDGGGVSVAKVGPKEAWVDLVQAPLCESRYFRNALRGVILSGVDMFCGKAYMFERPGARPHDGALYRIQWA